MKRTYGNFKDAEGRPGPMIIFVKFYNGVTWTLDRYNRVNKSRLLRRAVINRRLKLEAGR